MLHIAEISPVLGKLERVPPPRELTRGSFGKLFRPRYASRMAGGALDWTSETRGEALVLSPSGRVDESTADDFRENLLAAMAKGPAIAVIDLGGVEYMSSRGLRALTLAQRASQEAGTTIVLARPNDTMREILAISRYDMVFRVAETIEDATGSSGGS